MVVFIFFLVTGGLFVSISQFAHVHTRPGYFLADDGDVLSYALLSSSRRKVVGQISYQAVYAGGGGVQFVS